jgi:nucleoside-diphosphate-sugar epimerase
MERIIIGCGYLGRRLASRYLDRGDAVTGMVRTVASGETLSRTGIRPLRADLDQPPLPRILLEGTTLFYFAPPPREGVTDERVGNLISSFSGRGNPRRIVYLSTTGVYGDCGGEWVDERRPVRPVAPRALRRRDAELRFQAWHDNGGGELVILRVAGIYGPGKLPLDRLRKRLPLVRESEAPFSNRIHIDDLVQAFVAAMERGVDGAIYNVSDGHPSTMTDYFNRLAKLAGLPRPPLISLEEGDGQLSPGMMSYMRESRRLDNRQLREELGVELRYPDLESGLPACFRGQRTEDRGQK